MEFLDIKDEYDQNLEKWLKNDKNENKLFLRYSPKDNSFKLLNSKEKTIFYSDKKKITKNKKLVDFLKKTQDKIDYFKFNKAEWLISEINAVRLIQKKIEYHVSFENYNGLHFTKSWVEEENMYAPELLRKFLSIHRQTRVVDKIKIENMGLKLDMNKEKFLYSDEKKNNEIFHLSIR